MKRANFVYTDGSERSPDGRSSLRPLNGHSAFEY
jgi:hypothetical protein